MVTNENPVSKAKRLMDELLKNEWGIDKWAGFRWGEEDEHLLPGEVSCESARILTPDGKVSIYVLDWDPEKINPKDGSKGYYFLQKTVGYDDELGQKAIEEMEKDDSDYMVAKLELGLPLTRKQKKRAKEKIKEDKRHLDFSSDFLERMEKLEKLLKERE